MTVALYCVHDKGWDVKEEMHGWDVQDDTFAELVAIHEKTSRVSADN